jgi:hypothetical protein
MRKDKNPALAEHFEKLRSILPEVYFPKENDETDKLFSLLKHSLTVIEAVYLQHPESFTVSRYYAYANILEELNKMGYNYKGNDALVERATADALKQARLPMERAGTKSESLEKKVV